MKKVLITLAVVFLIAVVASMVGADEGTWFDTERCLYCRELGNEPGLLEHMRHEMYDLERGAISITTVDPEYLDRYRKAADKMMVIGKEVAEGKHQQAYVCKHCEFFGLMIMQGVDIERVITATGEIMIMSSDDSSNVALIREYAEKTRQAVEKMSKKDRRAD